MEKKNEAHFVGYDYKEILAQGERAALLKDCYESLGWELETQDTDTKKILFRRNRKIINKVELTRLERNLEACIAEIDALQHSKTRNATMISITMGLLGTVFMTGSVFAITAAVPIIWLCVVLAIPGLGLWTAAPLLYPKLVARRTETLNELIEKKYDEIYQVCEKGQRLLL